MLLFENELGWRLHKHRHVYSVTRAHPPLRSRVWQFSPVFVNILLVAGLWLGHDAAVRYVLYGVAGLFVLAWLVGNRKVRRGALYAIPAVAIFLGLLARDEITIFTENVFIQKGRTLRIDVCVERQLKRIV